MKLTIRNDFGRYRLRDPEIVDEGGFQGPCFRAEYQADGEDRWMDAADFRLDRIQSCQIELDLKTMKAAA